MQLERDPQIVTQQVLRSSPSKLEATRGKPQGYSSCKLQGYTLQGYTLQA